MSRNISFDDPRMAAIYDPRVAAIEVTPMWAGDLDVAEVDAALKSAGVPDEALPKVPSRAAAMRRAFEEIAPRGAKIDTLPKGLGVTMSLKDVTRLDLEALSAASGGAVREAASYHATLTAKVNVQNVNGTEIESVSFSPEDHPMVPLLREVYASKKGQYQTSEDLSVWFSQTIIPAVGGIAKRSRGGGYYVPASRRDLLISAARGLATVSSTYVVDRKVEGKSFPVDILERGGKLCLEPCFADDASAMEIMVDSMIRDADSTLKGLAAELAPEGGKPLGKRALATKRREAASLEAELSLWKEVTSISVELFEDRLQELRAAIGTAELALEVQEASENK